MGNITGLSLGIGITMGIMTFSSQNFGRNANDQNGVVLRQCNRALIPTFAVSLAAAMFADKLLGALGQPPEVLIPCRDFTTIVALGLPATWLSGAINSVLIAQRISVPSMISDSLAAISNLGLAYGLTRG